MKKKPALFIIFGLLIGAIFGAAFAPVLENDVLGVAGGAMFGIFIGWFVATAVQKNNNEES